MTGIDRSIAGVRVALTEALVADPRNDDHAVMSQLTALFALLHNGLIDIIRRQEDDAAPSGRFGAAYKRFLCARGALTAIYHNILRNDLMRRVIHPAIYAAYCGPAPALHRPSRYQPRALRSATGKFRSNFRTARFASVTPWCATNIASTICPSMTSTTRSKRPRQTTRSTCRSTRPGWCNGRASSRSTDQQPNFSRRIGPYLSDGLGNDQIFPAFDETERVGLLYRDLLGAGLAGMWSVDALIAEIGNRRPQFIAMSRLLADRAYRVDQLRDMAGSPRRPMARCTTEDIETLSNDPPLPFFVLFEAMQQPQAEGLRLGPLGSIIVSEVIFGALASDPRVSRRRLACRTTGRISREFYPANVFQDIPEISSMAQLVEFTTEIAELQQAVPAFL